MTSKRRCVREWRGEGQGFFFGSTRSVSRRRNDDHDDDDGQKQPTRESVRCPFLVGDGGSREGGAPASRPRGSRPRARLDAHLLLRQAERHQQALPQPHAGVGGTERGRVRAARASLGTSAFGRGATRERATSISARPKRCRPRARAEKRRLSSRSHSVRADASGVSASRLAEMGGDHRGGKRHRHGVRGL